ncbi:hypothetical protein IIC65_00690 [Candidatus Sumerlaeota bacterium]|nr:hypothetical protein [Candidatus Sumerlaeota bacterium]
MEKVELLAGHAPEEVVLAGGEPWVAEAGGWVSPLWFNPILSARLLASPAGWTRAALHPDAHPFGVRIAATGEIDLAGSAEDAFVIVARLRLPEPFPSRPVRRKVQRILAAEGAKREAIELGAMGFPVAEFIG